MSDHSKNEVNTRRVVFLTVTMMVGEIIGGWLFHSMALLADGFHMGTHAFALGVTLLAYWYARKNARNPAFTFGTGKVNDLGAYTSAILLLGVALIMAYESLKRFFNPVAIQYQEAIAVACIGLAVNLVSAWLLRDDHEHHHHHEHEQHHHHEDEHGAHEHEHSHQDHNLKAAYLHVLADALTSVLAIGALLLGQSFGWVWMDALMGVVGSIVITRWSFRLLAETSAVLLDRAADPDLQQQVRACFQQEEGLQVCDLHLWMVAPGRYALIASLQTPAPKALAYYQNLLAGLPALVHVTIEVNACPEAQPAAA